MRARISRHFSVSREEMEGLLRRDTAVVGIYKFRNDAIEFFSKSFCSTPVVVDVQDIIALLRKYVKDIPHFSKITEIKISPHKIDAVCVWYEEIDL